MLSAQVTLARSSPLTLTVRETRRDPEELLGERCSGAVPTPSPVRRRAVTTSRRAAANMSGVEYRGIVRSGRDGPSVPGSDRRSTRAGDLNAVL
jgi:hypothetical protein